jgi:hypothetical protein
MLYIILFCQQQCQSPRATVPSWSCGELDNRIRETESANGDIPYILSTVQNTIDVRGNIACKIIVFNRHLESCASPLS